MKILQVLPEMNAGGVERGTLEISAYLAEQGHEAVVVSNGGRMIPALAAVGARHLLMPVHRKRLGSLLQVMPFRRLLLSEKPDILHIRSRVPGWIAWLAWLGLPPSKRPRLVSTFHGFYSVNRYSAVMTRGERVIAVSECIREHILQAYPGISPEKVCVVPRGIDPVMYPFGYQPDADWLKNWHQQAAAFAGKILLLLPGRITRLKGHEEFFQLLVKLKQLGFDVHGLIVGDTHPKKRSYLQELHRLAETLGVSHDLSFLGHRSDVREIMTQCHLICSLSRQPESFGRTVLEALAMGKPVLGYDSGGVGELLGRFYPQGMVAAGDINALTEGAASILLNPGTPDQVGPPFTLESMCRNTLAVYSELVEK